MRKPPAIRNSLSSDRHGPAGTSEEFLSLYYLCSSQCQALKWGFLLDFDDLIDRQQSYPPLRTDGQQSHKSTRETLHS